MSNHFFLNKKFKLINLNQRRNKNKLLTKTSLRLFYSILQKKNKIERCHS